MRFALNIMIAFIAAVAVYDIYCTVALHDTLIDFEQNHVAASLLTIADRHIVHRQGHSFDFQTVDVSLLVTAKAAGLALSMSILQWVIGEMRLQMAFAIVAPVATGMLCLLLYLTT